MSSHASKQPTRSAVYAIGVDPGESAAVALCGVRPGERPALLGLWPIYASTDGLWMARAEDAVDALADALDILDDYARGHRLVAWMEEPPAVVRRGAGIAHHGSSGGLMYRAGVIAGIVRANLALNFRRVSPREWWAPLTVNGRTLGPKRDDGQHRVAEAGMLVTYAGGSLGALVAEARTDAARARVVDAAEAVLIAGAGALDLLAVRAGRAA